MHLTLTITETPTLPKEDLTNFMKEAEKQGKSAEGLLIELIQSQIPGSSNKAPAEVAA